MRPSVWPDELETVLLAKSAGRGQGGQPESLATHTWEVLCRLRDFVTLRQSLPEHLEIPGIWHVLYWATFLHDFGKAMPAFQGILRSDAASKDAWGAHRHELFSLAFLDWIEGGLTADERLWAAATIVSHHRDASSLRRSYSLVLTGDGDSLLAPLHALPEGHVAGLHRWLATAGWSWAQALGLDAHGVRPVEVVAAPVSPFAPWAAGRVSHWLRAYQRLVRRLSEQDSKTLVALTALRGTLINADHSGSSHYGKLPSVQCAPELVLQQRSIPAGSLYAHQQEATAVEGSALLVAPTGSGKTEAALLWAAKQQLQGAAPRLFYALPYQASMNAMKRTMGSVFGEDAVGLQHGRSLLALYRELMEREDSDPRAAAKVARQQRDLARLNYPPVRVFSPYQMLKGAYRLKGYEALLADYHSALFVFDEIHAYEIKRLALILSTMAYLRRHYGARFFVMSATFPTLIRRWLDQTLDGPAFITAESQLFEQFQRHRLRLLQGDLLENLDRVQRAARAGQSVLVVCNTVHRAQTVFQQLEPLKEEGIALLLLHGRFNQRDRLETEKRIQDWSGVRSGKRRPVVLVATQAVEVSLDIDLNTIFSDPAPLEALVQRFGRVNRARKLKDEAGNSRLAPVHVFTEPSDGQGIYDERLVKRTLAVLSRLDGRPLDEAAVGGWLDEIYADEIAAEWQAEFARASSDFERDILQTLRPFDADPGLEELFYKAFDGIEVLPLDLEDEYGQQAKEQLITAGELLVPISYGRYWWLRGQKLVWTEAGEWPIVVDVPYSREKGLLLDEVSA